MNRQRCRYRTPLNKLEPHFRVFVYRNVLCINFQDGL
jgi:hypothetical protein